MHRNVQTPKYLLVWSILNLCFDDRVFFVVEAVKVLWSLNSLFIKILRTLLDEMNDVVVKICNCPCFHPSISEFICRNLLQNSIVALLAFVTNVLIKVYTYMMIKYSKSSFTTWSQKNMAQIAFNPAIC